MCIRDRVSTQSTGKPNRGNTWPRHTSLLSCSLLCHRTSTHHGCLCALAAAAHELPGCCSSSAPTEEPVQVIKPSNEVGSDELDGRQKREASVVEVPAEDVQIKHSAHVNNWVNKRGADDD
eukprot:TRINITY_DN3307_c0_g1_i2.p2 TRINITY_DN3307_c0_g1~~TRINITY_DN3307_c0_g1_i2.p2  ORF type:complete len:121 (+),score=23.88 TRINITY_DN3307_c0_g1_i2:109-471(+)